MRAAVLTAPNTVEIQIMPEVHAGAGEVRVRVAYCGVCGSDIPRVFANGAHKYPIVLGHEFSGTIDEVGQGVPASRLGERVACAPLLPCHRCEDCMQGHPAQCANYSFIGSRVQGAMAECVVMPEVNAVCCGDLPFDLAALTEPSTVALHGLLQAGFEGGHDTAIVGAGTIGLLTLLWAKLLGARRVVMFDISPERLILAREMGADAVFSATHGLDDALRVTNGRGYGMVLETAGAPAAMNLCFTLAGRHSRVGFIGTSPRDVSFTAKTFELMNRREFLLTGSWMSYSAPFPGREWVLATEMAQSGRLPLPVKLIGSRFALDNAREAFDLARSGASGGRVLINIRQ